MITEGNSDSCGGLCVAKKLYIVPEINYIDFIEALVIKHKTYTEQSPVTKVSTAKFVRKNSQCLV